MMKASNPFEDRRKHHRKNIRIDVQLKVGINLKGSGQTQNISRDGILINSPELFCFFKPELTDAFYDAAIIIMFPEEGLTVQGKVIRIDASREELAILLTHRADERLWNSLCE